MGSGDPDSLVEHTTGRLFLFEFLFLHLLRLTVVFLIVSFYFFLWVHNIKPKSYKRGRVGDLTSLSLGILVHKNAEVLIVG